MKRAFALTVAAMAMAAGMAFVPAQAANEIDFVEDYVFAPDKDEAIKKLVPGTEQYYYYQCLRHQAAGEFEQVDGVLKKWLVTNKSRRTPLMVEIEHRQALLRYRQDPAGTLKYITSKLNLRFDHQRQIARKSSLPTKLDEALIGRAALMKRALANDTRLGGFEPSAVEWLIDQDIDARRSRHLLEMLPRADYAGLVRLIAADLGTKDTRGFGSLGIHNKLLKGQLDELAKLLPEMLKNSRFVTLYLTRLRAGDDVNLPEDPAEQLAHLERMWAFVKDLEPVFNSLKAHVLYHRLAFDRRRGVYDKDLFMEYLKLPRQVSYVRQEFLDLRTSKMHPASLSSNYQAQTLHPPIGTDEPLVRSYLAHFFIEEDSYAAYDKYVKDTYLKVVLAETKILNGIGDPEKWARMLSASAYKALLDRVDLDFAHTNSRYFAPDEKVRLDVLVKNVPKLIVKVYRVNALKYYQQKSEAVPIGLDLDGLVANEQKTYTYTDALALRKRRAFEFPGLTARGVYVIELIGSGKRSRALVRKGKLDYVARTTPAGHELTVLDESGAKVPDAKLWMAGRLYDADEDGTITIPFTNRPTRQNIVLIHKDAASLAALNHQAEGYAFQAGFYVDREALLRRQEATLIVRPQLTLNGQPISLKLLTEVQLTVTSRDLDGVSTTQQVKDFKLFEDRESTYAFRTPDRLSQIAFGLTAKIKNLSKNRDDTLSAGRTFQLNGIDATAIVGDVHLVGAAGKYALEMLGRNGEPLAERPVALTLKHRDFKQAVNVSLKTDAAGRIALGALKDIVRIDTAHGPGSQVRHSWPLVKTHNNYPRVLTGAAGETLSISAPAGGGKAARSELSLLEYRAGQPVADHFNALAIRNGLLEIEDLAAGNYRLVLKRIGQSIEVRVTGGKAVAGFQVSGTRVIERRDAKPVQIQSITADKTSVKVRLVNATKFTRVHVFAARYEPAYSAFDFLHPFGWLAPAEGRLGKVQSQYVAGRRISDEYRYILDRQHAAKLPGNMLKRPSLILNPWSPRKTETGRAHGGAGDAITAPGVATSAAPGSSFYGSSAKKAPPQHYANLDFLANAAVVQINLRPDKDGMISIARKDLLDRQHVRIVAVDPENTAFAELTLADATAEIRDLRLDDSAGLDPAKHFTQQKKISVAPEGKPFVLRDLTTTQFETFDTLGKVYRLFTTLNGDANLREFAFILQWPKLPDEEKLAKYSKYACHELHLFLYNKDRPFFNKVILPYLRNKKDKTFLDHWLVGDDLSEFLKPWRHAQLNVAERILLARRIAEEQAHTARHVKDLHDLLTPDIDRYNLLFDTALGLSRLRKDSGRYRGRDLGDMEAADEDFSAAGLRELASKAKSESLDRRRSGTSAAPTPPAVRPAPAPALPPRRTGEPMGIAAGKAGSVSGRYYGEAEKKRNEAQQFYRKLGQVQEWVENNAYHLPNGQADASLITVNAFWKDYAALAGKKGFLSTNLAEASRNFPEMMFAMALLDLPFEAPKHKPAIKGASMTITPGASVVIFHEEINAAAPPKVMPILVSQNYYRADSRYRHVNNEQLDNFVTDEFLLGTVYGCHVVVTNPTSSRRKLQVLTQIPQGSLPVSKGKVTRTQHILLEPYRTQTFDFFFYFPAAGQFGHYPVHVARRGELVAFAQATRLAVVEKLTKIDKTSWDYVSQNASDDEVLDYLKANNLNRLDLSRIAWRVKDKTYFATVIELLGLRHVYNHVLWSYGLKHGTPDVIRQYLQHSGSFVNQCGRTLDSPLLTIDPVIRKTYQHVEFWPLVNARAHSFGAKRKILVERLHQQYHQLLYILRYRSQLSDEDLMALTHYLLAQDRVEEAKGFFARVNPANLPTRIQHDYFTAYLDFYSESPRAARKIAAKYADYPVERWRNLFAAVNAQLDEIEGKGPKVVDEKDRTEIQTGQAAGEETFEFTVEAKKITLNYQNLTAATVNYYLMDIELMFSRQPFVADRGGQFAYIQPNQTQRVKLPAGEATTTIDLPAELHNRNVLVEVVAGGKTRTAAYYSHSLVVQMMENFGQLKVTHAKTGKALSKVYVKVYAQMANGQSEFYKDGYTDLRGRFDYTSLNTDQLNSVKKFAVLVLSNDSGSTVREAKPPKR